MVFFYFNNLYSTRVYTFIHINVQSHFQISLMIDQTKCNFLTDKISFNENNINS